MSLPWLRLQASAIFLSQSTCQLQKTPLSSQEGPFRSVCLFDFRAMCPEADTHNALYSTLACSVPQLGRYLRNFRFQGDRVTPRF
jgi:hypothetical protein